MPIGKRIVICLCIISIFLGGCSSENAEITQGDESICVEQNTGMSANEIVDSEPVWEQMSGEEEIMEFLRGNRNAYSGNGDSEGINIVDITTPTGELNERYFTRYTLFDSTGDGNPELHVKSVREYYIITWVEREAELVIWATCYPQTELLNNGAFLYTHLGGAPSHEDCEFFILDNQGNECASVSFSRYDSDSDGDYDAKDLYLFEGEEVTWEMWQESTEEYLSVGSDEIDWTVLCTEAVSYDVYSKELGTVAYPQVSGLEDKELERKVNESLAYVFEQDIAPDMGSLQLESYPPQIMFQSEKYLSVKTVLQYFNPNVGGGRLCSFPIYQTVSLETGELLQLDELLEVNEEFAQYLLNSSEAIRAVKYENADFIWSEAEDEKCRTYIKEQYGADDILAYFEEASSNYDSNNYVSKCSFYLTPGEINIVHETETVDIFYFKIRLELDDIQDYLKVDEW